jgi:uncharacterized membrane protein
MSWMWRTFLKGLVAVLPILLTVFVIYWLGAAVEHFLRTVFRVFIPQRWEIPGVGVLLGILVVFLVGMAMDLWITRRLLVKLERLVLQVPVVKSVYGAIRDFTTYFSSAAKDRSLSQVVMVELGSGMKVMGFVTRQDCADLPAGVGTASVVAVYFPMSYQIGGYTLYIARDKLQAIDMPIEEAMRLTLTAGVSTSPAR